MEPRRFAALARGLASSDSRRGAVRRFAILAAALVGRSTLGPAGAQGTYQYSCG